MANRGINKVILIGNLGQDPEVRHIPSGGVVTNITLATSENWKDKQTGETKEKTEWHRIVFFGKLAEIAGEYLKKGQQIYIEGSLQTRKWKDQNGHDRYTTEIVVGVNGTMQMIGNRQNLNNTVTNEFQSDKWDQLKPSMHSNSVEEDQIISSPKINSKKSITESDSMLDFDDDIPF